MGWNKALWLLVLMTAGFVLSGCVAAPYASEKETLSLLFAYEAERRAEYQLADRHYQQAIHVLSASGQAHNNYGVFLCRRGRYQQGINQLKLATYRLNYNHHKMALHNLKVCRVLQGHSISQRL